MGGLGCLRNLTNVGGREGVEREGGPGSPNRLGRVGVTDLS